MRRRPPKKYVLDTHIYINAFRNEADRDALLRFHEGYSPFEQFSVIVAQELRAGIRSPADRKALERHVLSLYDRAGRVITPTADAWHRSGDALAAMAKQEGLELARLSKAFANDVLLAASCREAGCLLITENARDFSRIRRFMDFEFMPPWP